MSLSMEALDNLHNLCSARDIVVIRQSRQRDKMKLPDAHQQQQHPHNHHHHHHQLLHQPTDRLSSSSLPKCFISNSSIPLSQLIYLSVLFCVFLALQATSDVAARRSVAPNFSISPPKINRVARIQYKTTYACEHRELHLNCEPNESIHLVRANYGRFSLSICNEGGRLDLSVMCMSYRSFLIMTDRCSNKSNCSVVVSSKLFGDPCPGTAKYLEVQYHCVRGGASLASSSSPSQSTHRPPVQLNIPLLGNNSAVNYPIEPVVPTTNSPSSVQDVRKHSEEATSISNNVVVTTASSISKSNWSDTDSKEHNALPGKVQPISHHYPTNVPLSPSSTTSVPSPITKIIQIDSHLNRFDSVNQPLPDSISLQTKPYPATNNLENSFFSASVENFCPTVFVRSLFWNWTRKGEISTQKCPGGATGLVKWRCNFNQELDIAEWFPARPDFSECRSLWLDNLEERLNNDEPVIRIASELAMMTLTKALYSEDLQRISHLIQRSLTHAVTSIQTALQTVEVWHRHQVLKELLIFIVETISNLLGNAQDDAWLDLNIASRKEVASALIKSLENSALLLAENTNHDGSSAIAKPNVLVSVHVLDTTMPISLQFPTYEDTSGTNEWARMEDSIFLPAQSLVDHSQGGLAKVAFFAYYRIEDLLKPTQQTDIERLNSILTSQLHNLSQSSTLSINSRVIGAAISQNGDIQNYPLSQPVSIVLRHIQEENISSPQCVYWNMEHQNWMTDGCWVESTNSSHTVCMCNHLTHFALLSEIKSSADFGSDLKLERMIVLASCFLALVVLAFVTLLIFMTPTGNTVATSIHRNLCLTLFMAELVYMIVTYFFETTTIASFSITLLHYCLLSTFFWTFFESFDIYMNVNSIYENFKSSKRLCWYYMFAYLSPVFIVLVCFVIDTNTYRNLVNLLFRIDNYVYLTFIGPIIGLTLGCLVFVLFAYILVRNNANTTTTIKCFEDIRIGCSKSLIRWILFLILFQCVNWSLALCYLSKQTSMPIAVIFTTSNVLLALFICLFCILKIENIQHSRLFRHLPFPFCQEESQLSSTKNSTTSDVYSTRPVVTQITSTQVNGINIHTPVAHSPSTPSVTSPVSVTSCLPQAHPLPISQSIHWNFQQEVLKNSTIQDHQSILAHQDPNYLLCNLSQANGIQTLPREFNSFYGQEPLMNSNTRNIEEALQKRRTKLIESNFEFASLHRSTNVPRKTLNRSNENKYTIQSHSNIPNYAPNLDHIYESIDTESMGSTLYDHNRRMNMLSFYGPNCRSKSTVNEDDLSSSSIYEDKPLLFSNNSSVFHDMNNRPKCTYSSSHYQSNASIYDKAAKDKAMIDNQQIIHGQSNALWQYSKDSNELPDLIQKANQSTNNLIVSYSGENKFLNKVINSNQTSKNKC